MTAADLQRLLACLPCGTELTLRIVLTAAAAPAAEDTRTLSLPAPSATDARTAQLAPVPSMDLTRRPDPTAVAADMQRTDSTARLTIGEWCAAMGNAVSARELKRAVAAGVLTASPRGVGRGHGAMTIAPTAMRTYLETRELMLEGSVPKGDWFFDVVRGAGSRVA